MKNIIRKTNHELKNFLVLWSTQSLSQLGSSMTGFALTLWLFDKTGQALQTALLAICSYAPYVLMSIFAGALSDKWDKKKTMLYSDLFAAFTTIAVFALMFFDLLRPWHLYVINAVNGLMNTIQQPAGDVAMTLIIPKKHYQRASGLRSMSQSIITILNPVLATMVYSFAGLNAVIGIDLVTFAIAFIALSFFVKIPKIENEEIRKESTIEAARSGLGFLKQNGMVFTLILFLAGVNFVASTYEACLPAYVLLNPKGNDMVLGVVTSFAGIATLAGSIFVTLVPKPKNRVRVIYLTMFFSLTIENFMLAFSREPVIWCISQIVGWVVVPVMSANLDVIIRSTIPVEMQGRVYACRNTFQYFTIPLGLFLGGFLVDDVCEPFMARFSGDSILNVLFGIGPGSGAAAVMFIVGILGGLVCLLFGKKLEGYKYSD